MADFPPDGIGELLLLPLLLTFFGLLVYFLMRTRDVAKRRVSVWRLLALIPVLVALYVGYKWVGKLFGAIYPWQFFGGGDIFDRTAYRATPMGMKILGGHWAAFGIPAFGLLIALGFEIYDRLKTRRGGVRAQAVG